MVAGLGNPAGFIQVYDGEAPRIITGYARENISGGTFVAGSTAADVVSSGANSFAASDIKFTTNASGTTVNGVAISSAASGAPVAVCTRGTIIALADGTVTAGESQIVSGVNGCRNGTTAGCVVGRALTGAASGGYFLLSLNL